MTNQHFRCRNSSLQSTLRLGQPMFTSATAKYADKNVSIKTKSFSVHRPCFHRLRRTALPEFPRQQLERQIAAREQKSRVTDGPTAQTPSPCRSPSQLLSGAWSRMAPRSRFSFPLAEEGGGGRRLGYSQVDRPYAQAQGKALLEEGGLHRS